MPYLASDGVHTLNSVLGLKRRSMGRRRSAPHTIQRCEALACFALARRVGGGPQPAPGVLGLVAHLPITTPAPSVASVTHSYPPHHNLSYTSTMKFTLALLILGGAALTLAPALRVRCELRLGAIVLEAAHIRRREAGLDGRPAGAKRKRVSGLARDFGRGSRFAWGVV